MMKACQNCKQIKDESSFRPGRKTCRDCTNKKYKEWANSTGRLTIRKCNNKYYRKNWNTPEYRFLRCKTGSKQRGIHFDLTLEQFKMFFGKRCTYCGEITDSMGLDRINSNLGYVVYNICPCCKRCNMAKNDMNRKEFVTLCKKIIKNCDTPPSTTNDC